MVAFTIGHSTRPIDRFVSMLKGYGITRLVDVRTVPRSRTNPQFNKDVLPDSLPESGIACVHVLADCRRVERSRCKSSGDCRPHKTQEHKLTPFAKVNGSAITYHVEAPR